jgi:hypothetical protein
MILNARFFRAASAVATLALLGACSAGEPLEPSAAAGLDAAVQQASLGNINALNGGVTVLGFSQAALTPPVVPSLCNFSSADQSFDCPAGAVGGLTIRSSYILYDLAGVAQSQLNGATTDAVRVLTDVTGTVTLPSTDIIQSVAVNHHSDMRLSGLLSGPHTLNGASVDHDVITSAGVASPSAQTTLDITGIAANIVFPSSGETRWPTSGTVTNTAISVTTSGSLPAVTTTAQAVMTFNGTNLATVVVTFSGRSQTCTIDLSGASSPRCA